MKVQKASRIGVVVADHALRGAQRIDGKLVTGSVPLGGDFRKDLKQLLSSSPFIGKDLVVGLEGGDVLVESLVVPPGASKSARAVCAERLKGDPVFNESNAALGVAVDGDADRFGIVDADGAYIHANHVLGLLSDYLIASRGWRGEIVRSVPTSHLLDAVAGHHGASVVETPTGFKYIGERSLEAPEEFILGGEESNGMTVRGHIPEKDGILACLLVAEMVAVRGATLSQLLEDLFARVGRREVDRLDLELPDERKRALLTRFDDDPPTEFAGRRVERIVTLDGHKLVLDGGAFIALRASGTEPLVRCYLDATDMDEMAVLKDAARELIAS